MTLFISHASEDRVDFVRPLAEALSKEYEKVWYCEYELTLGDSLLQRIDAGLSSCDFGIVVLSKPFFEKKWPRAELDGLFALETKESKLILPIWKDITEDEVKRYSPILAGKLAVSTTTGLENVLTQIRLAINVSERQQKLTATDAAARRVQALRQTLAEKQSSERLLQCERGAALVLAGVDTLWASIQSILSAGEEAFSPIKFTFSRPVNSTMYVGTVRGMHLSLQTTQIHSNAANNGRLEATVFKQSWGRFGEPTSELQNLDVVSFKPVFRSGEVLGWTHSEKAMTYKTEELAGHLVDLFVQQIELDSDPE
jgi:hypothetical protein